eukprot:c10356_g1_i1 orf=3-224(-)
MHVRGALAFAVVEEKALQSPALLMHKLSSKLQRHPLLLACQQQHIYYPCRHMQQQTLRSTVLLAQMHISQAPHL